MFVRLKMDLVKYYLVTCFKAKNKVKLMEFFTKYSKEILSYGSVKVLSCSGANNSTAYKGNDNGSNVGMMNGVNSTLSNSTNTGMISKFKLCLRHLFHTHIYTDQQIPLNLPDPM